MSEWKVALTLYLQAFHGRVVHGEIFGINIHKLIKVSGTPTDSSGVARQVVSNQKI
jgi:hypothetical protein